MKEFDAVAVVQDARLRTATQRVQPTRGFATYLNGLRCGYENPSACCFCALGAVYKALGFTKPGFPWNGETAETKALMETLHSAGTKVLEANQLTPNTGDDAFATITRVNDELGREAVLDMFDRTLRVLETEASRGDCF